ncbi:MAG: AAA family ATPase [Pseudomonadota bacterium]
MEFPPVEWTVDGYIVPGLTVLAGKPKLGKSWLALDMALAVAGGGVALGGRRCAKGSVLYAALEDTRRRLRDRLEKVHGARSRDPWPANLTFWSYGEMARLDAGGLDQLRAWLDAMPDAKLIIIDTLAKVRSGPQGKETAYEADYREVGTLKALADEYDVAIMVVTHTRKLDAEDPFDTVSGTLGITGAADTTLILTRDGLGVTLRATGRDVAETEMAVEFERGLFRWREIGEAAAVRRSDERGALLDALREAGEPLTARDLATDTGQTYGNVRRLLAKMAKANEVQKVGRGRYLHPDLVAWSQGVAGREAVAGKN